MSSEARQRKMADRIKVIVAETLEMRIKDPRLGFITITDVRVTPDLREASVFYTVYGDDEERAAHGRRKDCTTQPRPRSRLRPPTNTSPNTMQARPKARVEDTLSRKTSQANKVVHKGRLPGISTDACAAGA